MALSGTITGSKTGQFGVEIDWSGVQNISNNSTTITAKVYITYYTINISSRTVTCTIAGITQEASVAAINKQSASSTTRKLVGTFSQTIKHDSEGKASCAISASFPFKLTQTSTGNYIGTLSASGTVTLNTIPRASSISFAGAVTLGDKCNIRWTPLVSTYVYKIKLQCGSVEYISDFIAPNKTTAYTYAATMSVSYWASALGSSYSATCRATLYTYPSKTSNSIGSSSTTFKITLPSEGSEPTVSFADPVLVNGWQGYYVQGKSSCKLSATFSAGAGSDIKSCSITGPGLSITGTESSLSGTTSVLTKSGTLTYTATVTDGRATSSATTSIEVLPYARPTLSLSATRTSTPGQIKITYKALCTSLNSTNNLSTLKIYRKLSADEIYPTSPTKTVQLSSTSVSGQVTLSNYETTASYDFKAVVIDDYGSSSAEAVASVTSEFRTLNISEDKKRLSIGKMAEDNVEFNLFDCAFPARFLDNIEFTSNNSGVYGSLETDYNESGNNIVYIRNGQDVEGGASMALAIHKASVYIAGEANDGLVNLGSGSRKWNQLFAANETISTSDQKVKTDIEDMSDIQEQLFNKLQPVTYKFINGTSNRTHYGFISQDVENSLEELNLTGRDFAGFCKDLRVDENGKPVLDEEGKKIYDYSLRYAEFIALNTYMIQKLQAENKELRAELQTLKEMIIDGNTSSNNVE